MSQQKKHRLAICRRFAECIRLYKHTRLAEHQTRGMRKKAIKGRIINHRKTRRKETDMVVLNDEMKKMLANNLAYIATVDEQGNPNIGPKISVHLLDDSHIIYYERTGGQHFRNLTANQKMVIGVSNEETMKGFRFHGTIVLHKDDQIFKDAVDYADQRGLKRPKVVPEMTVTRVDYLDAGAKAGTICMQD